MEQHVELSELTDQQKVWMTQVSYLQLTDEGKEKIKNGGLTVDELEQYLEDPNGQFCGNAIGGEGISKWAANTYIGRDDQVPSSQELVQKLRDVGLGDMKVTDIADDHETGFQAMALQDSQGNIAISYRGSDCQWGQGGLADWVKADAGEFVTNDSQQVRQALEFFDRNKNESGQNYVYGHSLGGSLTSHTYVDRHDEIAHAFTYNGVPVNQKLLDSQEKIDAFNDPKYECTAVAGDIFQHMKRDDLYGDKVKWIKPDGEGHNNWLNAHLPAVNTYNQDGSFVTVSREEAKEYMPAARKATAGIMRSINTMAAGKHKEKEVESLDEVLPSKTNNKSKDKANLNQTWDKMISNNNRDISQLFDRNTQERSEHDISLLGFEQQESGSHGLMDRIGDIFGGEQQEQGLFSQIGDIFAGAQSEHSLSDIVGDIFGGNVQEQEQVDGLLDFDLDDQDNALVLG